MVQFLGWPGCDQFGTVQEASRSSYRWIIIEAVDPPFDSASIGDVLDPVLHVDFQPEPLVGLILRWVEIIPEWKHTRIVLGAMKTVFKGFGNGGTLG